uniref:Ephrin-B3 n=1 Tax=Pelodiscus sinensis TaxID=13735 RepID=K7G7E9_PELSI|nr:ephrin-B3 [Pelodiscus sinensis]XP_006112207.1 ephrin-B3 [Pelodiscus sinensis]XP_025044167.1 ephrin-B3 [Pelodiscus sinensis]|eukprot:XP_006112206.1 ephrin-B3 [Pelodiscus sinensis]
MALGTSLLGFYIGLLFSLLELWIISAVSLEPIYWNTANKKFQAAGGYILYPQIGDRLDLICPRSRPPGPFSTDEYEFYKLYLVPVEQARACEILRIPNLLLTCDRPEHDVRFTIKFQEYSPNLWGHEFKSNQEYYIITTSDGTKEGLENLKGGACLSKGMKVILKVGQHPGTGSKSQKSVPEMPPEQARGTLGGADPSKESGTGAGNSTSQAGGENGPLPQSNVPVVAGAAGGATFVALAAAGVAGAVCWRRRRAKQSDTHHPSLSLSGLSSPKRGAGSGGGNNNGSEPSDIIIPLRTADGAFCPHYEKVSGDYGHPVYIVQEMPPQSPANIYYKV